MAFASIDLKAMAGLVSAADNAVSSLPYDQWGFHSILNPVDVDPSPASGIGKVSSWLEGEVPGLKRRLALAQAIEAKTPGQQFTVKIDESEISNVPPAQAQADGQALAKQLRDANGNIDPKLFDELKKYQNDPYFAAGLTTELTPSELGHIVDLASQNGRSKGVPGTDGYKKWFSQYKDLLASLGTTMGTATRNTGDLALPAGYADEWTKVFTADPGDDNFHYGEAMSLGYLMRFGQYSTDFLDHVSADVYNYERHQDGKVWSPKAGTTPQWPVDPTGNGLQTNVDVLSDIMYALGNNPVAAQNFFDVGNPDAKATKIKINGKEVVVNDRLKYLLLDRTWSFSACSDEGKGLGLAVDAASTYFRNAGGSGHISAQIASQTLAMLGDKIGSGGNNLGFGTTWNLYTKLRPAVAHIVASYMPDLYRIVGTGHESGDTIGGDWAILGDNPGFPPGMPWGAQLDVGLMKKILHTLGEDESNIQIVTAGAAAAQRQLMSYALASSLSDNPHSPELAIKGLNVPLVQNSATLSSNVLGWIVNTAYEGDKNKEEADKKRAELISKTLSMVSALPMLPTPEGKWSEAVFDQAKDYAIDKIGEHPEGDASGVYGKMDGDSKESLTQSTLNLMLQAGYMEPKYYDAANQSVGGHTYQAPPPDALRGKEGANGKWQPDQPPEFDFDSPAYRTWSETYSPNAWLQTNVLGPYNNAFPNIG